MLQLSLKYRYPNGFIWIVELLKNPFWIRAAGRFRATTVWFTCNFAESTLQLSNIARENGSFEDVFVLEN